VPTINRVFQGDVFQDFVATSPMTGTAHVTNEGNFHVYIRDVAENTDYKVIIGATMDIPIVQGHQYTILVCGDVSITYTLIPA